MQFDVLSLRLQPERFGDGDIQGVAPPISGLSGQFGVADNAGFAGDVGFREYDESARGSGLLKGLTGCWWRGRVLNDLPSHDEQEGALSRHDDQPAGSLVGCPQSRHSNENRAFVRVFMARIVLSTRSESVSFE